MEIYITYVSNKKQIAFKNLFLMKAKYNKNLKIYEHIDTSYMIKNICPKQQTSTAKLRSISDKIENDIIIPIYNYHIKLLWN